MRKPYNDRGWSLIAASPESSDPIFEESVIPHPADQENINSQQNGIHSQLRKQNFPADRTVQRKQIDPYQNASHKQKRQQNSCHDSRHGTVSPRSFRRVGVKVYLEGRTPPSSCPKVTSSTFRCRRRRTSLFLTDTSPLPTGTRCI